MLIFAIETSCDETAAAVVADGRKIVSNVVSSQIKLHAKYSGVVPELASRAHIENINIVIASALKKAGLSFEGFAKKVSAITYTRGPGLAGSLLVGQMAAETLSAVTGVPLTAVNHLEGHIFAAMLEHKDLKPPFLSLIVSGGHTELVIVKDFGSYRYLGGTRDDAAGEAFDKVARFMGLPYPGGPVIDRLSKDGDPEKIHFTRPMLKGSWDFSFSGIKTAVVNIVKSSPGFKKEDICASFQSAVVETLVAKTLSAAAQYCLKKIVLGGGVAANSALRKHMAAAAKTSGIKLYLPSVKLCTDNAAMMGCAGYYKYKALGAAGKGIGGIEPGLKLSSWNKR